MFPVLQTLALPSGAVRQGAARVLSELEKSTRLEPHESSGKPSPSWPQQLAGLLEELWVGPKATTVHWIADLASYLQFLSKTPSIEHPPNINLPLSACLLTSALMLHPEEEIRVAASRLLKPLTKLQPLLGLSLLPAVMWWLRREQGGPKGASGGCQVALLEALAGMTWHAEVAGPATRLLQPMLAVPPGRTLLAEPKGPRFALKALAMRLLTQMWTQQEKVFAKLRSEVMAWGKEDPREVRVARGVSIRDICKRDAARGCEVVLAVQALIEDPLPPVTALGLEALGHLCADDAIDFYTAWRVVNRTLDVLPSHTSVAAQWATFLGYGDLDALHFPDTAAHILELLWGAATWHPEGNRGAKVRGAAYEALGRYALEVVEEVRPVSYKEYVLLLLSETDAEARQAGEHLVIKVLAYEHSTRRRHMPDPGVATSSSQLALRLLSALPRVLSQAKGPPGTRGRVFPSAALLISPPPKPPPPPGVEEGRGSKVEKQAYAEALNKWAYEHREMFLGAADSLSTSSPVWGDQGSLPLLQSLATWRPFLPRWLTAQASSFPPQVPPPEALTRAATATWQDLLKLSSESIPRLAQSAVLAAGCLACSLPSSAQELVNCIASHFEGVVGDPRGLDWARRAGALGLGLAAANLHPTEHELLGRAAKSLQKGLADSAEEVQFGCGVGLGLLCGKLADQEVEQSLEQIQVLRDSIQILLTQSRSDIKQPSFQAPSNSWGPVGALLGLAYSLPALETLGSLGLDIITQLTNSLGTSLTTLDPSRPPLDPPYAVGVCLALPAFASAALRLELVTGAFCQSLLNHYSELVKEGLAKKRAVLPPVLILAASLGGGSLLHRLLLGGYPISTPYVQSFVSVFTEGCQEKSLGPSYRVSACLGLANALGGEVLVPGGGQSDPQKQAPLIGGEGTAEIARGAVQRLIEVVQKDGDQKVRAQAAWALGFLKLESTTQGPDRTTRGLLALPEDSAIRHLAEYVLKVGSDNEPMDLGRLGSALRCLGLAPRLPDATWHSVLRRIMRDSKSTFVRQECIQLSLAHSHSVLSLAGFLDETCSLPRLVSMEAEQREVVLGGGVLPGLLLGGAFSHARVKRLLADCRELSANADEGLQGALWSGLGEVLRQAGSAMSAKDATSAGAATSARDATSAGDAMSARDATSAPSQAVLEESLRLCTALFCLLPSTPPLGKSKDSSSVWGAPLRKSKDSSSVWGPAIECLSRAPAQWLLQTLPVPGGRTTGLEGDASKAVFARCLLVIAGALTYQDLIVCRAWCTEVAPPGSFAVAARLLAEAYKGAYVAVQRQCLLDTLDLALVSNCPLKVLELVTSFAKAWSPLAVLCSPKESPSHLSNTLPTLLLNHPSWQDALQPTVQKLTSLLRNVAYDEPSADASRSGEGREIGTNDLKLGSEAARVVEIVCSVLVALRHSLKGEAWDMVIQLMVRRMHVASLAD